MDKKQIDKCSQAVLAAESHDIGLFNRIWDSFTSWNERSQVNNTVSVSGHRSMDIFGILKESISTSDKLDRTIERVYALEELLKDKSQQEASVRVQLKRLQRQLDGMNNHTDAIDLI